MTRSKYALLVVVILSIYLKALLTGLNLGRFEGGLLLLTIVFIILTIAAPSNTTHSNN